MWRLWGVFFLLGGFVFRFDGWRERDEEKCKERREMRVKESYQLREENKGQDGELKVAEVKFRVCHERWDGRTEIGIEDF